MNTTETKEAAAMIGMMLKAFPSSQSNISDDSARVYLFAVEDFSLEAVKRACRMFVRGDVPGRNNSFCPSAPELADVCKITEGQIQVEAYEASRVFIEEGSAHWLKMEHMKGGGLMTCTRNGKKGWFFEREEAQQAEMVALPPPMTEEQMAENAKRIKSLLTSVGTFNSADDDQHDMGQMGSKEAAA